LTMFVAMPEKKKKRLIKDSSVCVYVWHVGFGGEEEEKHLSNDREREKRRRRRREKKGERGGEVGEKITTKMMSMSTMVMQSEKKG